MDIHKSSIIVRQPLYNRASSCYDCGGKPKDGQRARFQTERVRCQLWGCAMHRDASIKPGRIRIFHPQHRHPTPAHRTNVRHIRHIRRPGGCILQVSERHPNPPAPAHTITARRFPFQPPHPRTNAIRCHFATPIHSIQQPPAAPDAHNAGKRQHRRIHRPSGQRT